MCTTFISEGQKEIQRACSPLLERIERVEVAGFTSSLVLHEVMYKILLKGY